MPVYEFICQKCGKPSEFRATVAEYSKGLAAQCPHCGSTKLIRSFSSVGLVTSAGGRGPVCGPGAGPGCCGR